MVEQVKEANPRLANQSTSTALPPTAAIEFRNLSRRFGKTFAVQDVSFSVMPGEVVGYIGPNGAGKTTSMRILATLDDPTSGDAFVHGFSVIEDPERVRRRIGFMPDDFGTYPYVDCEEYLDFFARAYGLKDDERRASVHRVVEFAGLGPLLRKPINKLSKGMKQRLGLGRALIHDPDVLILDEPAAGLDPRARIELRDMVAELAGQGKALLISSHILTELGEMCQRLAILEAGQLLACGSVEEILDKNRAVPGGDPDQLQLQQTTVELDALEEKTKILQWLSQQSNISDVRVENDLVLFSYTDNAEALSALLKQAIEDQIKVTRFAPQKRTLEQAFLEITNGRVQ